MAKGKGDELRNMDTTELETRLTETRQALFNLRFQHVTGQMDNVAALSDRRREVARILTILREREISEAEAAAKAGNNERETA